MAPLLTPEAKKPWLSKTLWLNAIVAGCALFSPTVSTFIASNIEVTTAAFAGLNFLLRLITKNGVSLQE